MTATGSLTLDGRPLSVEGDGLVRPPVGRLHLGRRRRLGLVRGQPRRRHGPDAVARPRRGRQLPARLRHRRRPRRDGPSPRSRRVHVEVTRPLGQPGDRRRLPGRAGRSGSPATTSPSRSARPSPTRSSTRGRRPASSTGRARRSCRRRAAVWRSAVRATWSSPATRRFDGRIRGARPLGSRGWPRGGISTSIVPARSREAASTASASRAP